MKTLKMMSFALAGMMFVETATAGSMEDIDRAFEVTAGMTCEQQEGLLQQLDKAYEDLGQQEEALEKAHTERPDVEVIKDVRNTAAVLTTLAGITLAFVIFEARTVRDGPYSLPAAIASRYLVQAAVMIAGTATAMAQAGYVLINDDVIEFQGQIKKTKELIKSLRNELKNCR